MSSAYFDCYNGISGDMALGALIDLGAGAEEIARQLRTMPIGEFRLETERVKRVGVSATRLRVVCAEAQPPQRHLRHVEELLAAGRFSERVRRRALTAFRCLAEAEAEVHDTTVEQVHFHEVGALDAIIDVTGAMIAAELLEIDDAACSVVAVGGGTVECSHGQLPVPAPAAALLLKGVPLRSGPVEMELATPTGAAILRSLCSEFGGTPGVTVKAIGYGAGAREIPGHTNYLRVLLGSAALARTAPFIAGLERRRLELIATEIDDMSAELYSALMTQLYEHGALDVLYVPLQMKKNRPGIRVEILCGAEDTAALLQTLLEETTTLGARVTPVERFCFHRRIETLQTPLGEIRVKLALLDGGIRKAAPEYEDCRMIAIEKQIPLQRVFATAIRAIEEKYFFSN